MHSDSLTVFIVDDDPSVRDSIALMLGLLGFRTAVFADAEGFLSAYQADWTGCVVADLRLPGKSGLELQAELACSRQHAAFCHHYRTWRCAVSTGGVSSAGDRLPGEAL